MSDTTKPGDIPIPWLKQEQEEESHGPEPSWGTAAERQTFLGLRYLPTWKDHWRCMNRVVWVRPGMSIFFYYFFGFMMLFQAFRPVLDIFVKSIIAGHIALPHLSASDIRLSCIMAAVFMLLLILFKSLFTPLAVIRQLSKRRREMKQKRTLLLTSEGVEESMEAKTTMIPWNKVVAIVENHGDLYILGKLIDSGFYIPCSAFNDRDAVQRFYTAAVTLWKAQGNSVGITPEVYEEFKPQISLASTGEVL